MGFSLERDLWVQKIRSDSQKREREREEYILRESERLGEMVGSGHANCCVNEKWCVI